MKARAKEDRPQTKRLDKKRRDVTQTRAFKEAMAATIKEMHRLEAQLRLASVWIIIAREEGAQVADSRLTKNLNWKPSGKQLAAFKALKFHELWNKEQVIKRNKT